MYKNIKDTVSYLQELESLTKDISRDEIELFIIPSYTTLDSASKAIDQKNIRLGAQNMCWEEQGQFTGEISPLMLQEAGIGLVMIGHSERRHVFGETDIEENKKVLCALEHGFKTLLCIGETAEEKEFGISAEVLRTQLKSRIPWCICRRRKEHLGSIRTCVVYRSQRNSCFCRLRRRDAQSHQTDITRDLR